MLSSSLKKSAAGKESHWDELGDEVWAPEDAQSKTEDDEEAFVFQKGIGAQLSNTMIFMDKDDVIPTVNNKNNLEDLFAPSPLERLFIQTPSEQRRTADGLFADRKDTLTRAKLSAMVASLEQHADDGKTADQFNRGFSKEKLGGLKRFQWPQPSCNASVNFGNQSGSTVMASNSGTAVTTLSSGGLRTNPFQQTTEYPVDIDFLDDVDDFNAIELTDESADISAGQDGSTAENDEPSKNSDSRFHQELGDLSLNSLVISRINSPDNSHQINDESIFKANPVPPNSQPDSSSRLDRIQVMQDFLNQQKEDESDSQFQFDGIHDPQEIPQNVPSERVDKIVPSDSTPLPASVVTSPIMTTKYANQSPHIVANSHRNGDVKLMDKLQDSKQQRDSMAQSTLSNLSSATSNTITTTYAPNEFVCDLASQNLLHLKDVSNSLSSAKLRSVNLSNNQLTYLTEVPGCVEVLYLDCNRLTNSTSFSHLVCLRSLILSRNQLTDVSGLSVLKSLEELDISFNQIADISPLNNMHSLRNLSAQNNRLSVVDLNTCVNMMSLQHLNIGFNRLKRIKGLQVFHRSLKSLILESNQLSHVTVTQPMLELETLNLSHNRLVTFSGTFFHSVVELVLDYNCIADVEDLDAMGSLSVLSIEKQTVDDGMIVLTCSSKCGDGIQDTLRSLRISDNQLTSASLKWLSATLKGNLEVLKCSHMNIKSLESLAVPEIQKPLDCLPWNSLKQLNISHNCIESIEPLIEVTSLVFLDVSSNHLRDIASVLNVLRSLTSLEVLDMR